MLLSTPLHPPPSGSLPQPISLKVSSASHYPKLPAGQSVYFSHRGTSYLSCVTTGGGLWEVGVEGGVEAESQLLDIWLY